MINKYVLQGAAKRQRIVIIGTGGLARELHQVVEDINEVAPESFEMIGWLDSDQSKHGLKIHDYPVLGDIDWLTDRHEVQVVIGIGSPVTRRRIVQQLHVQGHKAFARLIHPSAVLGNRVEIGEGVVICAGVVGTTDFKIGSHVLVNICATLAHEDLIGDFVTIAPGANVSGNVSIGEGTDIGTNATLIQGVSVGEWSIVGAGAVVARSLPSNVTAVGAPARPIKEREPGWHEVS
ncbi:acetyltransferase [Deinococcus xinjiangensis]|uniref:acetyltransferase n=1 Tax=Deinococcus xinjiangensis TaxID=457454 RepID=UPI0033656961